MPTTTPGPEGVIDRRGAMEAHLELDPDPRRLRQSLQRVTDALAQLEPETARKVRHLVVEIIARSFDRHRPAEAQICLDICVLPTAVRVEASGGAISTESWERGGGRESGFPTWAVDDLVERGALDRRTEEPSLWFLVEREAD